MSFFFNPCYWVDDPSPIIWIIYPPTRVGAIYSLLIVPFFFRCQRFLCKIGYLLVFFCCLFRAFFWASCGFLFLLDFLRLFRQVFNKNEEVHALFSQLNGTQLDKKDRLKAIRKALPNSAWDLLCHVTTHPPKKEKKRVHSCTFWYDSHLRCAYYGNLGLKPRRSSLDLTPPPQAVLAEPFPLLLALASSPQRTISPRDFTRASSKYPTQNGRGSRKIMDWKSGVFWEGIWDIVPRRGPPFWCLDPKVEKFIWRKKTIIKIIGEMTCSWFSLVGQSIFLKKKLIKWSNMAEMVHFPRDDVW